MSHIIIDRSKKNKASINREKFMKRSSTKIKNSVRDFIANDSTIKSITDGKEKRIKVNSKTLDEPTIVYDNDNDNENVLVGNDEYQEGDRIAKPYSNSSAKGGAGNGDSDSDDFYFTLTHKEFVDIFFEDLELPDFVKKNLLENPETTLQHSGYTSEGPPSRLDLRKTMINSLKRNFAISGAIDSEIKLIMEELKECSDDKICEFLKQKLEELENQKENIPFLQDVDLRYRRIEKKPIPSTKAVMFCIMDVSGSMTEWHKEMAKRFFMILYLFLTKQYENVDLVFIRYHHEAMEVNENDFFYNKDSGGTIVSTAFTLMDKIIKERYDKPFYNLYACQISDGDNFGDSDEDEKIGKLFNQVIPKLQYFAYVEVSVAVETLLGPSTKESTLMSTYHNIRHFSPPDMKKKISLRTLFDVKDVYLVFRSLFSKNLKQK